MLAAAMGVEGDLVQLRFARGCRCFAAWRGTQVIAYGWLSEGPEWIGELELEIRPGPGEAYVWNCVTLPAQRRTGLFRALLLQIAGECRREGLSRLWLGGLAAEPASKALPEAGFTPILDFELDQLQDVRRLGIGASEGADPALVSSLLSALGLSLGTFIRPPRSRRH
jgi:GNAT superfamily N-acetyltransferase